MSDDGNSSDVTNVSAAPSVAASTKSASAQKLSKAATMGKMAGTLNSLKIHKTATPKGKAAPGSRVPTTSSLGGGGGGDDLMDGIETMMSQLVNTSKMESAWQKLSRRISFLEEKLAEAERKQEGADAFVTLKEFMEFVNEVRKPKTPDPEELTVEKVHLQVQEAALESQRLNNSLRAQADQARLAMEEAAKVSNKMDEVGSLLSDRLQAAVVNVTEDIKRRTAERLSEEAIIRRMINDAGREMKEIDKNVREFAEKEAEKATRELLFSGTPGAKSHSTSADEALSQHSVKKEDLSEEAINALHEAARTGMSGDCETPEQWRRGFLQMVEAGLMQPFRHEVLAFKKEYKRNADEVGRQFKTVRDQLANIDKKIIQNKEAIKEEGLGRSQDAQANDGEFQKVYAAIAETGKKATELDAQANSKIQDLTTTVEKHTEKLAGHTKDILNSATTADAKKLQDDVRKLTPKEMFKKYVDDTKTILDYNTEKIDGLSMQVTVLSSAGGGKAMMKGKNKKNSGKTKSRGDLKRDPSAASAASSKAAASTASAQASLQSLNEDSEVEPDSPLSPGSRAASRGGQGSAVGDPEDQEGFDEVEDDVEGASDTRSPKKSPPSTSHEGEIDAEATEGEPAEGEEEAAEEVEVEEEEDYEEESEEEDVPGEVQLREQVQGICMGLVCLGQHVLRGPPQCGLSRQNRLLNEKELLEELLNLREWVTQKYTPADWSLDKLMSVSLRYAHPNPMEVHGPQPEMNHVLQRAAHSGGPFHTEKAPSSSGYGYVSRENDGSKSPGSRSPRDRSPGRNLHPLNLSVGSIGIGGPCGANPGGGAGIMGERWKDNYDMMATTMNLPFIHGGKPSGFSDKDKVAFPTVRPPKKMADMPMSAREPREVALRNAPHSILPPLQIS
mmetsp:Transcript_2413/g.4427  ORF Transcript_2413/g.4427 Transcript_2413/m.4427 type:complete len:900 (-) Transcript_2413:107-2806(-)